MSILAHGETPIKKDTYEMFEEKIKKVLDANDIKCKYSPSFPKRFFNLFPIDASYPNQD